MNTFRRLSHHLRRAGNTEPDHVHHDRAWWRVEARRLGADWAGILRLHSEVIDVWRARHDPDYGRAVA